MALFSDYAPTALPTPAQGCAGSVIVKDGWMYYCGAKGITETTAHDDRRRILISRPELNSLVVIRIHLSRQIIWCFMIKRQDTHVWHFCLMVIWLLLPNSVMNRDSKNYTTRPAGWMRLELFILSTK